MLSELFTMGTNPNVAKPPLESDGGLAKFGLTSSEHPVASFTK